MGPKSAQALLNKEKHKTFPIIGSHLCLSARICIKLIQKQRQANLCEKVAQEPAGAATSWPEHMTRQSGVCAFLAGILMKVCTLSMVFPAFLYTNHSNIFQGGKKVLPFPRPLFMPLLGQLLQLRAPAPAFK